ncbi:MAG TPA: lipoyl(octanoyl) transferase LipB [Dehalococcoidia bacterium]|nr:lipoyl(octanoyl) transferase LipB [Dehalococcoidia bacterium]
MSLHPEAPEGPEVPERCEYTWLGRVDYLEAWDHQRELARRRALGEIPDTLLLLEHPPVFTTGRRGPGTNLRLPQQMLGAPLIESDRGGDITWHGPGQLIVYPIVDLRAAGMSVVTYVRSLEETIIRTIRRYGIEGETNCDYTGVWVGREKIAAIGVRAGKPAGPAGGWVTTHGLALNVTPDLSWFERIVPCGISGRGVASIKSLTGETPSLEAVANELAADFGAVFGHQMGVNDSLNLPKYPIAEAG